MRIAKFSIVGFKESGFIFQRETRPRFDGRIVTLLTLSLRHSLVETIGTGNNGNTAPSIRRAHPLALPGGLLSSRPTVGVLLSFNFCALAKGRKNTAHLQCDRSKMRVTYQEDMLDRSTFNGKRCSKTPE